MRSLEEWQNYVEQQIEAARKRRSGSSDSPAKSDPAPTETATATEEPAPPVPPVKQPRIPQTGARLPEGRALLTWEDTSPVQKSTDVPPPSPLLSQERLPAAEPPRLGPSDRLGRSSPDDPTKSLLEGDPGVPAVSEEADDTVSPGSAAAGADPQAEPLKPYQPRDPRWRSSVAPPRLRAELPATEPAAAPSILPAPAEGDGTGKATTSLKPSITDAPTEPAEAVSEENAASPPAVDALSSAPEMQEEAAAETAAPATPKKRARRLTAKKAETTPPPVLETPEQLQALWDRVPRHVQALIRTQNDEVAQRSYKNFRETREDLIFRLLDPELSLEEAARILAVCPTTVRRYTNRGLLPHHRTPGNQRRFRLSHVLEFMERYGQSLQNDAQKERNDGMEKQEAESASDSAPACDSEPASISA